jgi:hypothetical protein
MGLRSNVARDTLANANATRDWHAESGRGLACLEVQLDARSVWIEAE